MQFWSEILLVILNRTRSSQSSDFKIMRMISDQIALYSVQLPVSIIPIDKWEALINDIVPLIYLLFS